VTDGFFSGEVCLNCFFRINFIAIFYVKTLWRFADFLGKTQVSLNGLLVSQATFQANPI
jgi:hypothetical protein